MLLTEDEEYNMDCATQDIDISDLENADELHQVGNWPDNEDEMHDDSMESNEAESDGSMESDTSIDEDLMAEETDNMIENFIKEEIIKCTKCDSQFAYECVLKFHINIMKHKETENLKTFACAKCKF